MISLERLIKQFLKFMDLIRAVIPQNPRKSEIVVNLPRSGWLNKISPRHINDGKLELFGSFECCDKDITPTVKHDPDTTTIWSCYVASGLLAVIDGTKNFTVFKKILKMNHKLS